MAYRKTNKRLYERLTYWRKKAQRLEHELLLLKPKPPKPIKKIKKPRQEPVIKTIKSTPKPKPKIKKNLKPLAYKCVCEYCKKTFLSFSSHSRVCFNCSTQNGRKKII